MSDSIYRALLDLEKCLHRVRANWNVKRDELTEAQADRKKLADEISRLVVADDQQANAAANVVPAAVEQLSADVEMLRRDVIRLGARLRERSDDLGSKLTGNAEYIDAIEKSLVARIEKLEKIQTDQTNDEIKKLQQSLRRSDEANTELARNNLKLKQKADVQASIIATQMANLNQYRERLGLSPGEA